MLNRIINSLCGFFEEIGKAKAASHLARLGHYKEAQALMSAK